MPFGGHEVEQAPDWVQGRGLVGGDAGSVQAQGVPQGAQAGGSRLREVGEADAVKLCHPWVIERDSLPGEEPVPEADARDRLRELPLL